MSGHTPGPWVAYRTVAPRGWNIEAHDGTYTVAVARDGSSSPQNVANARLIAASPRMYDYIAVKARAGDKEAQEIISGVDHAQG